MVVIAAGRVSSVRAQSRNENSPMVVRATGKVSLRRDEQPLQVLSPIVVSKLGRLSSVKLNMPAKAEPPMSVIVSGRASVDSDEHPWKAWLPIVVIVGGRVSKVSFEHLPCKQRGADRRLPHSASSHPPDILRAPRSKCSKPSLLAL